MTVESVEKRDRRTARMRRELAAYRRSLGFFEPCEALSQMYGLQATWSAVRRLATELIGWPVSDVMLAWQIVYFVRDLPDGKKRLKAATEAALTRWEADAMTPTALEQAP